MSIRRLSASLALPLAFLCLAAAASAASPARWGINAVAASTVAPGATLEYSVFVKNTGGVSTSGEYEVLASLPAGLIAKEASLSSETVILSSCHAGDGVGPVAGASSVKCTAADAVPRASISVDSVVRALNLVVQVAPTAAGSLTAGFRVAGGSAAAAATVQPIAVTTSPAPFGIDAFDTDVSEATGKTSGGAAVHPALDATNFTFNLERSPLSREGHNWPVAPVRDVQVDLPPGLIGNASVMAQCSPRELTYFPGEGSGPGGTQTKCPSASQVGLARVRGPWLPLNGGKETETLHDYIAAPLFNMTPSPGSPATFGFEYYGSPVFLQAKLSPAGGYHVAILSSELPGGLAVQGTDVEFWGDPAAPAHDNARECPETQLGSSEYAPESCPEKYTRPAHQAFLRNPTACTAPGEGLTTTMRADSWFHPGVWVEKSVVSHEAPGFPLPPPDEPSTFPEGFEGPMQWGPVVGIEGCEAVPFSPSMEIAPTAHEADSPSGLHVGIGMPQQGFEDENAISESDLKKVVTRFPAGVTLNPSSANGQEACTSSQIGLASAVGATPVRFDEEHAHCPDASKIGTVQLESPLVGKTDDPKEHTLDGSVYLAKEHDNPFGSLLAIYVVVEDERTGTILKLPGRVNTNPSTGQIETVFDENPQLPFTHLSLDLFGGSRAALRLPAACGEYSIESALTGWSGKTVETSSPFKVETGPGGGACPSSSFAPSFASGTVSSQAGAFSPMVLSFARNDGEQQLSGLTDTFAPGLLGRLAGTPRCDEADANAGTCPASSRIGGVTVLSGSGASPVPLHGTVYLTGPYNGGPFGEAVVVPADAGPFNLGNVVVRGSIRIDPTTAQAQVVSDPFPQFVGSTGIPSDVRRVEVVLDRPGFTFNATNCDPLAVTGTLTGAQGTAVNVANHYQASNCAALKFKPSFKAVTQGNGTFNHNGASLYVKLTTGQGPGSGEANIRKVEVQLPKKLPARLSTLQKACTEGQFAANPAGCPAASDVGTAIAHTPLLDSPVTGPAYLVSHGGQAFPDLVLILQGEGIVLQVTGHTQIKNGITYSRFETVPDAPISTFELNLPESPASALAATQSLCSNTRTVTVKKRVLVRRNGKTRRVTRAVKTQVAEPLTMPTTITAQDNAVLKQTTKIAVTGCAKAVKAKAKKAKTKKKSHKR
jgi:uncharacterized repeat protein (TIGR01451 family)